MELLPGNELSVDGDSATTVREHVRVLLIGGDAGIAGLWAEAAREDVSLDLRYAADIAAAVRDIEKHELDVAVVATSLPDGSYRAPLRALHVAREEDRESTRLNS